MEKTPEKKTQGQLNFRPLSEGLGFHPFSDGLPYAPMAKTGGATKATSAPSTGMGTGATAAGPATFAATIPAAPPRVSVPVATPPALTRAPQITPPRVVPTAPGTAGAPALSPAASVSTNPSGSTAALDLHPSTEARFGFGYLLKRAFAWIIDSVFNLILCVGALTVALWGQDLSVDALVQPGVLVLALLFMSLFSWALLTAQEVAFGTSVGKRLFGLHLQGTASATFLRAFFFLPSLGFCGLGLLWGLVDRRRRCWHDVAVDLQPVEYARL